MAKNLVRIERYLVSRYGYDGEGGWVVLLPKLYMENEAHNFDDYRREDFITSDKYFWQV